MKPRVNIVLVVDVVGALSQGTLRDGNLCMIDDGADRSTGQGTPELCTVVRPGQIVQWSAVAIDVQTPVEIESVTFLGAEGVEGAATGADIGADGPAERIPAASDGPGSDRDVWAGVVPAYLPRGVPQRYRVGLRMSRGEASAAHVDTASLKCL